MVNRLIGAIAVVTFMLGLIGSVPARAQAPARLFVEDPCAFEPPPVGCSELAGIDPSTATTLGEVIVGSSPGRLSRDEITVYKAMGVAIEVPVQYRYPPPGHVDLTADPTHIKSSLPLGFGFFLHLSPHAMAAWTHMTGGS